MDPFLQQILALTIVAAIAFTAIGRFLSKWRRKRQDTPVGCSGCGDISHCSRDKFNIKQ